MTPTTATWGLSPPPRPYESGWFRKGGVNYLVIPHFAWKVYKISKEHCIPQRVLREEVWTRAGASACVECVGVEEGPGFGAGYSAAGVTPYEESEKGSRKAIRLQWRSMVCLAILQSVACRDPVNLYISANPTVPSLLECTACWSLSRNPITYDKTILDTGSELFVFIAYNIDITVEIVAFVEYVGRWPGVCVCVVPAVPFICSAICSFWTLCGFHWKVAQVTFWAVVVSSAPGGMRKGCSEAWQAQREKRNEECEIPFGGGVLLHMLRKDRRTSIAAAAASQRLQLRSVRCVHLRSLQSTMSSAAQEWNGAWPDSVSFLRGVRPQVRLLNCSHPGLWDTADSLCEAERRSRHSELFDRGGLAAFSGRKGVSTICKLLLYGDATLLLREGCLRTDL
ncbi:uncharacterized protein EV422DRAFT_503697 [Fimicolochytrium jonesii]|uniref:uncharacterized protein n=1 Tax=Fimicolochytrium jonesii TaxID=1396493 RepID=UPI0022FDD90B|nr:uncharacterized protein EV422DRAFT_503697 [Fimicolochytrium jonesii]KAI8824913.1 hypothetical protein EV422DRAFT_503697 [Fimicolochytrium jonesii]